MANEEHVAILKQGVEVWNAWRQENSEVRPDLSEAALHGARLRKAYLREADLRGAHLNRAYLSGANLSEVDLSEADLSEANLREAYLIRTHLSGADLSGARLDGTHLSEADLSRADLRGTDLNRARLNRADLNRALLTKAVLSDTDLWGADLRGADLRWADLIGANLTRVNLNEADLSEAECLFTQFSELDLSKVIGLETIMHRGPSHLDTHTLEKSKGKIPEVFLRGCGVSEILITFIPSLTANAIDFYSCFISYSHDDKPFARRVHDTLQGRGIRCWLDEKQMLPGDDIYQELDRGIRLWDKVLLCASEHSLTSWWVDNEISTAFNKEQQIMKERGNKTLALIPLDLDGYLFSDAFTSGMKTQLHQRLAANFKGWEHDNAIFEREIERVIKALRTDGGREMPPEAKL